MASGEPTAPQGKGSTAARVTPSRERPPVTVPPGLRNTAVVGASLLVIAAAIYLVVIVLVRLAPLTLAVVAALLMAALIGPVSSGLRRLGTPPWLAALAGILVLLGAIALPFTLITNRVVNEWSSLRRQTEEGLDRVRQWLLEGPLSVSERQINSTVDGLIRPLREALPDPVGGATAAAQGATSALLALVLLFFLLKDGEKMARWALSQLPRRHRGWVAVAAVEGWRTLVAYIRGTFLVAVIDGVGIGLALVIIGVPLALPLGLLTFIAAFIPIVGATVAGAVAVLVALVSNGLGDALLTLGAVLLVQQAEGNLLQPVIQGRSLRLHPAVILIAVTAGTLLGGIAGAVVAVPVTAITYRVTMSLRALKPEDNGPPSPPPDTEPMPAAGGPKPPE